VRSTFFQVYVCTILNVTFSNDLKQEMYNPDCLLVVTPCI